mgnify:CR=1 FL=1
MRGADRPTKVREHVGQPDDVMVVLPRATEGRGRTQPEQVLQAQRDAHELVVLDLLHVHQFVGFQKGNRYRVTLKHLPAARHGSPFDRFVLALDEWHVEFAQRVKPAE